MSGTLRDTLAGHLGRQPDRTFLLAPETGRRLSYQELEYQARLLARIDEQLNSATVSDRAALFDLAVG